MKKFPEKRFLALLLSLFVIIANTAVASTKASPSIPAPTVNLAINWHADYETPYPNSKNSEYDPSGAGQSKYVDELEDTNYVIIKYEYSLGKNYSTANLMDEAYRIFRQENDSTYQERTTKSIAQTEAGYVLGYNIEANYYSERYVFVKNEQYIVVTDHYTHDGSQVTSLIESISVGPPPSTNTVNPTPFPIPIEYTIIGIVIVVALLSSLFIFRIVKQRMITRSLSIGVFPVGWQFYEGLTAGDPPGTVYRFTKKSGKQRVETIKAPEYPIELEICKEEVGNYTHTATLNTFVQFTGLKTSSLFAKAGEAHELTLEMPGLLKEITYDVNLDPLIERLINKKDFHFREDERYFVIRQARKTKEINYKLTQGSLENIGGEATLKKVNLEGSNLTYIRQEQRIRQKFDTYRRVMFNAEELKLKRDRDGRVYILR